MIIFDSLYYEGFFVPMHVIFIPWLNYWLLSSVITYRFRIWFSKCTRATCILSWFIWFCYCLSWRSCLRGILFCCIVFWSFLRLICWTRSIDCITTCCCSWISCWRILIRLIYFSFCIISCWRFCCIIRCSSRIICCFIIISWFRFWSNIWRSFLFLIVIFSWRRIIMG